jgi:hypothetical protein
VPPLSGLRGVAASWNHALRAQLTLPLRGLFCETDIVPRRRGAFQLRLVQTQPYHRRLCLPVGVTVTVTAVAPFRGRCSRRPAQPLPLEQRSAVHGPKEKREDNSWSPHGKLRRAGREACNKPSSKPGMDRTVTLRRCCSARKRAPGSRRYAGIVHRTLAGACAQKWRAALAAVDKRRGSSFKMRVGPTPPGRR